MANSLESRARAAALGALSGGTLGFGDELYGYLASATPDSDNPVMKALYAAQTTARLMPGQIPPIPESWEAYKAERDKARAAMAQAQSENPKTYMAGQFAGAVPLSFVPGMGQMNMAKTAAMGAAYGIGESPTLEPKDLAIHAGTGAAMGAGGYGAIKGAGMAAKAASPYAKAALQRLAAENAALGEAGAMFPKKAVPPPPQNPNFQKWFEFSKVRSETGEPKVVYSGHSNAAMYGTKYEPRKGTAGGFFATEDPDIASNYAAGKIGVKEYFEHGGEYRLQGKGGKLNKKLWQVELTPEQTELAKKKLLEMGYGYDDNIKSAVPYDKEARRLYQNPSNLQNIHDFLEGMGETIGYTEEKGANVVEKWGKSNFEDLMDELGLKWDSYKQPRPGVMPVYLNITNPLDTSRPFPPELLDALKVAAKGERTKNYDTHWTKDFPLKEWIKKIEEGDEYWSTQIPAKAMPVLKRFGYDGIKDVGGKGGGPQHPVWIAFDPEQIKSATGNVGTFDPMNPDITRLAPVAVGAGALKKLAEDDRGAD
jgi:hypothetical protein